MRERRHDLGTTAHVVAFLANGRHAVCSKEQSFVDAAVSKSYSLGYGDGDDV